MSQLAKAATAVRLLRDKGAHPTVIFAGKGEGVMTDHFNVVEMPVNSHLSIGVHPCTLAATARAAVLLGDKCSGVIYVGISHQNFAKYIDVPVLGDTPFLKNMLQLRVVRLPYLDHFSIGLK